MLCFRDMTFCGNERHAPDCERRWTPELSAAAERWWGGPGAPVAFGSMCEPDVSTEQETARDNER